MVRGDSCPMYLMERSASSNSTNYSIVRGGGTFVDQPWWKQWSWWMILGGLWGASTSPNLPQQQKELWQPSWKSKKKPFLRKYMPFEVSHFGVLFGTLEINVFIDAENDPSFLPIQFEGSVFRVQSKPVSLTEVAVPNNCSSTSVPSAWSERVKNMVMKKGPPGCV